MPLTLPLKADDLSCERAVDEYRFARHIGDAATVEAQAEELLAAARPEDGEVSLLVAEMVRGQRELIAGMIRDPQFGPCVMLGLGGSLAEALGRPIEIAELEVNLTSFAGRIETTDENMRFYLKKTL